MSSDGQQNNVPTSWSEASNPLSTSATSRPSSPESKGQLDQTVRKSKNHERSGSRSKASVNAPSLPTASPISPITSTAFSLSSCPVTPISTSPKDVQLTLSPISIRYESTTPATPPAHCTTPAIISPARVPLPFSPSPLKPRSKTPPAATSPPYHPPFSPRTPPQRPPRPSFSLPNLRPTIILSPILASALPAEDRPSLFHLPSPKTHYKRTHTRSPHSSSSSSEYITALPSPVFFAPRDWSAQGQHQCPPLKFSISPTDSEKEPVELQVFRYDWMNDSITAFPPPCPPPTGPLPLPPSPQRHKPTEMLYPDEKILFLHKETGRSATWRIERAGELPKYYQRHRRTLRMIATIVLIVVLAGGVAGGIIWKLQSMCSMQCR